MIRVHWYKKFILGFRCDSLVLVLTQYFEGVSRKVCYVSRKPSTEIMTDAATTPHQRDKNKITQNQSVTCYISRVLQLFKCTKRGRQF